MGINYYAYIQSDEWRRRANEAKQRAGHRCQVCNRSSSEVVLNAHHRTYDRLGDELPEDITVLCRDCHKLYEENKKIIKAPKGNPLTTPLPTQTSLELSRQEQFSLIETTNVDRYSWQERIRQSIVLKRIGQVLATLLFVVIFLAQCARDDIFVQNHETGEYESLLSSLLADAIRWTSSNLPTADPLPPTVVPTATPATAEGRIEGYFRELTINLARLERDVSRIEADRSDKGAVYLVGTSIYLTYWSLENMQPPPKADTEQVSIAEDYTEAHAWLLDVLQPCQVIGTHAMTDEPGDTMIDSILQAHDECKERVQFLKEKYPQFFVCPPGEPCR